MTATSMTDRAPGGSGAGNGATAAGKAVESSAVTTEPVPCSRTIRGGPVKAQNMITMRPLSRRWATVSIPEPVRSR